MIDQNDNDNFSLTAGECEKTKTFRTPQEKKRLILIRDRRNCYGESRANSRHSIKRNKKLPTRAYRHKISQTLHTAAAASNFENAEILETKVRAAKRRDWKKCPDAPLGAWIADRFEYRKRMFQARIKRKQKREE